MKVYINEKLCEIKEDITLSKIKDLFKKDADIVVYNGFITKEDYILKDNDKVVLIKRGEFPSEDEMEAMLVSRHTPFIHERIKKSTIGIAGLGGLGSNVAISLARIGVGRLLLVDFDVVEPSNLNRQQYFIRHLGMHKTDALEEIIKECNPFVDVIKKNIYLTKDNIEEIFKDVDIVVEAFDNPVSKAEITNTVLSSMKDKKIVAASGMAGYDTGNNIVVRKIKENFYLVGDCQSEAKPGSGLMAPRVSICANQQANTVLRIILGEE